MLVLGQLAELRSGSGWFSITEVKQMFEALRVPAPANPSAALAKLKDTKLVIKGQGGWSLTPLGRTRVNELIGNLDPAVIEAEIAGALGAELGHALHTLIPPAFAPVKWAAPIKRMLESFPFEMNVFCMTRFPESADDTDYLDPVHGVITTAREALKHHGLTLHLASDRALDDDLYANVAAHMWTCRYGIGLFEDRAGRGLNYNLVIEVGSMMMTGRRCALLKDKTAGWMPTDFVGTIYRPLDFDDLGAVSGELHKWAAKDIGLGRCSKCPKA